MTSPFRYEEAFSRNIGWITREEQARLRGKRVAIAGLGGVGGSHLLTLARLGVGSFALAEFDYFELANFNRQAGANILTLGLPKLEVMLNAANAINPEIAVDVFPGGVNEENVARFLEGADVYLDGLDFFAFDVRQLVFERCAALGIPAITVAPLGMGAALLTFVPGGISFEEYFRLSKARTTEEKALRFLLGLSPLMPHAAYLVDPSAAKLERGRGPSTSIACEICAGIAVAESLKIMLHRGKLIAAPRGVHFDAYRNKLCRTWRPGGNANPLQQIAIWFAGRMLERSKTRAPSDNTIVAQSSILPPGVGTIPVPQASLVTFVRAAIQAPSADNRALIGYKLTEDGVQLWVRPDSAQTGSHHQRILQQVAIGASLENLVVMANSCGYAATVRCKPPPANTGERVAVHLSERATTASASDRLLAEMIPFRHTNRRFYSRQAASPQQLELLRREASLMPDTDLIWLQGPERSKALRLVWRAESERFRVRDLHEELFSAVRFDVGWKASCAEGLPPASLEVEPALRKAFHLLSNWNFMKVLNILGMHRLLGLRAAFLPCKLAPHLGVIVAQGDAVEAALVGGRALQRVWLRATALGMALQPLAASTVLPYQKGEQGASAALRHTLRQGWQEILGDKVPVMLFRAGFSQPPTQTTGRLPVEAALKQA